MATFEDLKKLRPYTDDIIVFRHMNSEDKDSYCSLYDEEEIIVNAMWECAISSENELIFMVSNNSTDEFIGYGSMCIISQNNVDLGYRVLEKQQRKGYATRILNGLLSMARELYGDNKITARVFAKNVVSRHIIEKMNGVESSDPSGIDNHIFEAESDLQDVYSEYIRTGKVIIYEFDMYNGY